MRIPAIKSGANISRKVYYDIKSCNPYVMSTLDATEQTIDYVKKSEAMAKVGQKLGKPLAVADAMACNGLKVVEMKYPFILVAPQDFKVEALKRMHDLKGYGSRKFGQVLELADQHKHVALEKLWHYLDILVGSKVSFYVDLIDKQVDHYMPNDKPNGESDESDVVIGDNVFKRVSSLSSKIKGRISKRYHRLVLKVMWSH